MLESFGQFIKNYHCQISKPFHLIFWIKDLFHRELPKSDNLCLNFLDFELRGFFIYQTNIIKLAVIKKITEIEIDWKWK